MHASSLHTRLIASRTEITAASRRYIQAASAGLLSSQPVFHLSKVSEDEMSTHYDTRFVRRPGRVVYDQIRARARGICPMCGHRAVSTLDHYLPKRPNSALAVCPANLVPCCADCNRAKGSYKPRHRTEELIHPYFDDLGGDAWLRADVTISDGGYVVRFEVSPPTSWSTVLTSRLQLQYRKLGLAELYMLQAADELRSIMHSLNEIFGEDGNRGVSKHLDRIARSRAVEQPSSWQAAMYRALADSSDFCDGPFV